MILKQNKNIEDRTWASRSQKVKFMRRRKMIKFSPIILYSLAGLVLLSSFTLFEQRQKNPIDMSNEKVVVKSISNKVSSSNNSNSNKKQDGQTSNKNESSSILLSDKHSTITINKAPSNNKQFTTSNNQSNISKVDNIIVNSTQPSNNRKSYKKYGNNQIKIDTNKSEIETTSGNNIQENQQINQSESDNKNQIIISSTLNNEDKSLNQTKEN